MVLGDSNIGEASRDGAAGGVGVGVTGGDDRELSSSCGSLGSLDTVKLKLVSFDWLCNARRCFGRR